MCYSVYRKSSLPNKKTLKASFMAHDRQSHCNGGPTPTHNMPFSCPLLISVIIKVEQRGQWL